MRGLSDRKALVETFVVAGPRPTRRGIAPSPVAEAWPRKTTECTTFIASFQLVSRHS